MAPANNSAMSVALRYSAPYWMERAIAMTSALMSGLRAALLPRAVLLMGMLLFQIRTHAEEGATQSRQPPFEHFAWWSQVQGAVDHAISQASLCTAEQLGHAGGERQRLSLPPGLPHFMVNTATDAEREHARDPAHPEMTLREAIARAREAGGGRITFDAHLSGRTIVLLRQIDVPSNVEIDGGCIGLTITSEADIALLSLRGTQHAVVRGLTFTKLHYHFTNNDGDTASVWQDFDDILFERNIFFRCGDGCLDITAFGPPAGPEMRRIVVRGNLFTYMNRTLAFGSNDCLHVTPRPSECLAPVETLFRNRLRPWAHLELERNLFWLVSQRHPRVDSHASANVINNLVVLRGYRDAQNQFASGVDGVYGTNAAYMRVAENIFVNGEPDSYPHRAIATPLEDVPQAEVRPAFGELGANLLLGRLSAQVFRPHQPVVPADRPAWPDPALRVTALAPNDAVLCLAFQVLPSERGTAAALNSSNCPRQDQ